MQYTKSYGCLVLFLQDILLFDLTFLKFMTQTWLELISFRKKSCNTVSGLISQSQR